MNARRTDHADAVVIGAGFGGLGAALTLAEAGASVVLLEALNYPGGCASTYRKHGLDWEAGATLFTGFAEGQLFRRWIDRHALDVGWTRMDPVVTLHVAGERVAVPADRARWVDTLAAAAGDRGPGVRAFFREQGAAARSLWDVLDDPDLLPPLGLGALARHLVGAPGHLPWVRWLGSPLLRVLERHGVADVEPLRTWLDATCQVTVQASAADAEAPFALASVDFPFRGVVSVDGGIGTLARALTVAIANSGGRVRLADRVRGLEETASGWRVNARRGPVEAPVVLANVPPTVVSGWLAAPVAPALTDHVRKGWGAAMLYLAIDAEDAEAGHHHLVADRSAPLVEGNHALVSVGDVQAVDDRRVRTVTVSTHLRMDRPADDVPSAVADVQQRLRTLVTDHFPAWRVERSFTGSPRTFARFTGRPGGFVGGIPRTVGLHHYRSAFAGPVRPGLHLVGDSVFPGQSTLAAAIGGQRAATRALRTLATA